MITNTTELRYYYMYYISTLHVSIIKAKEYDIKQIELGFLKSYRTLNA